MKRFLHAFALVALVGLTSCSNQATQPVVLPVADSVAVSPDSITVAAGAAAHFTVTAFDSTGQAISAHLEFTSSDPTIFVVDGSGRVTGISEGRAELYVSSGAAVDSGGVTVTAGQRGWFAQSSGATGIALNGVFFLPDGRDGWAVGAVGRILATSDAGATWNTQSSGTTNVLMSVWFTSATDGWVAGKGGIVLHTTNGGATWSRIPNGSLNTSADLEAVRFAARDTGWVAGSLGVILRTFDRGVTWTHPHTPTQNALHSLSFAGSADGWAVGDGGVILGTHDRGTSWYTVLPSPAQSLRGVWRVSATRANAVGAGGATVRTAATVDSLAWTLGNAGALFDLRDVCFPAAGTGFAVGTNGTGAILRSDDGGASWGPQTASTSYRLNGVFFIDAQRGWAVGENGVILHTATGGQP